GPIDRMRYEHMLGRQYLDALAAATEAVARGKRGSLALRVPGARLQLLAARAYRQGRSAVVSLGEQGAHGRGPKRTSRCLQKNRGSRDGHGHSREVLADRR